MLSVYSAFVFVGNLQAFEDTGKFIQNANIQNTNVKTNNDIVQQPELRKQLLDRSKQYLLSIENNLSVSPETKNRIRLQSQKLVETGLKKLSDPSIVQRDSLRPANEQIDTVFFVNALHKINSDCPPEKQNKKVSLALKTASNNALRAIEFLRGYYLPEKKIYVPTIREVMLRVAIPNNIELVRFIRQLLRRNTNSNLFGGFLFGAIGCNDIISTPSRLYDLKSFAQLLAKNIKSVTAPEIQITNFSFKIPLTNNICVTSILVAETVVLRN
ncbi:MAG: hypothetical protein LBC74_06085 [Planctomycetaceae bacterium]|nr:hypothetical protein [Planctomycetaceae bacterium]